jgi:SAM-dependent methyltransferase
MTAVAAKPAALKSSARSLPRFIVATLLFFNEEALARGGGFITMPTPMQESLVPHLACPACRSGLTLESSDLGRVDINEGRLSCPSCARHHPVKKGVPRLIATDRLDASFDAASRFGWQWLRCQNDGGLDFWASEELFLEYIHPVPRDFLRGKTVLDAGCGMGRFTRHALNMGATAVYAVDLSPSVEVVQSQYGAHGRRRAIQADFLDLPLTVPFDFIFTLGVLHHLKDPAQGFARLARHLKPGGHISIWVYGRENNDWIVRLIDPVRKNVTSRLPIPVVHALSYILALGMYPTVKVVERVSSFYNEYVIGMLKRLTLRELAGVILDHLQTPTAAYLSRLEIEKWFQDNGVELLSISPRNANSWRAFGRKT